MGVLKKLSISRTKNIVKLEKKLKDDLNLVLRRGTSLVSKIKRRVDNIKGFKYEILSWIHGCAHK